MMGLLLMLCVFCCPLVLSESGDDDTPDGDPDWNVTCSSSLSFSQNNLTCYLNDESIEGVLILCSETDEIKCTNPSQGPHGFTFSNLQALVKYKLQIKPGNDVIKENIKLTKIVKLPAPQIKIANYMKDSKDIFISIQQNHDFVKTSEFQVKVLRDKLVVKNFTTPNKNVTISREIIGEDGVYDICVRVKPSGYFDGMWSEWSPKASFTIEGFGATVKPRLDPLMVTYIIIFVSLVFIISFVALQWKTHIKGYIKPNIPHPKTTLAQIHRGKEGFPYIFSPEIFGDVFIHRVDYDEKSSAPDLQESLDERRYSQASSASSRSTVVCELDTTGAELLSREQSHLKIRLLNESDFSNERREGGSEGVLQRECKEEAYVTMSSLFKTQ
ncbi:interleukin-7 receptor subunit alpha isoform X2 [Misgurnus anguillicaudatus]|uniref:interleukin-7 receptor subunit alpha isoform X2 n=1 Tax=Misgurnus anguillicaudatus TaxID=75329 RepID=UPI003CCFD111